MFIRELTLRNFKTVKEAHFSFKKGVICFTGNNGEGKSTVLHAILLMLFNETYEGTLKDSIRWGEKEFSIKMSFDHEGRRYTESLSYSITKGTDRVLTDELTGESYSGSSAIAKMAEVIDPDQARAAIVSMENEQNLVTTTPSQRREYLKKIYSLEFKQELQRIASDIETAHNDIISAKAEKVALEAAEFPLKEEMELPPASVYEEAKEELASIDRELMKLQSQEEEYNKLVEEHEQNQKSLKELSERIDELNSKQRSYYDLIETSEGRIKDLSAVDYDIMMSDELGTLEEEYASRKQSLKEKLDECSSALNSDRFTQVRVSKTQQTALMKKSAELSSAITESSKKLSILRQGKCPTCGRDIDPSEAEKEAETLRGLQAEQQSTSELLKAENDRVSELEESNLKKSREQQEWQRSYDSFNRDLQSIDNELSLKKENIALKYQSRKAERDSEIKSLRSTVEMSCDSIESTKSLIKEAERSSESILKRETNLGLKMMSYSNLEETIAQWKYKRLDPENTVNAYEDTIAYNKSVKVYNDEMKKRAEERDEKVNALTDKITRLSETEAMMTVAKGIVQKEFPSFVISRMIESLKMYVNEFLDKVYPKYDIAIEESKNSLNILYGEYKTDVKMASGFEKSAFSLAYMYALGKIQAYGLLICDEGDSAASDENSARFYQMLGKSTDWLDQIMCITHKNEIKDLLKNDYHAQVFTVENGVYREEAV